jgi:hypothetical protein
VSARRCLKPGLHAPHKHQRAGVTYECDGRHGQVAPGRRARAPYAPYVELGTGQLGQLSPESQRLIAELADAMRAVVDRAGARVTS